MKTPRLRAAILTAFDDRIRDLRDDVGAHAAADLQDVLERRAAFVHGEDVDTVDLDVDDTHEPPPLTAFERESVDLGETWFLNARDQPHASFSPPGAKP